MTDRASEAGDASESRRGPEGFGLATAIAVAVVILCAVAARIPFVSGFAPDDDEFYTLRNALEFFKEPTPDAVRAYPLTFLAARLGLELGGIQVGALRWFPLILGIVAVGFIWRRGRPLIGDRGALLAAGLLAIWPWHQYFSGLARYYAPLFFAGIGVIAAAWKVLERPDARRVAVLAGWLVFGILVHPSAAFGLMGLISIAFDPRVRGRGAVRWLVAGVVSIGGGYAVLRATGAWHNIERVLSQEGGDGANAAQLVFNVGFNVTPLLLALAAVGWVVVRRANPALARFLALTCSLPLVALAALAATGFGVQGRYAMAGLPALIWLAGAGAAELVGLAASSARKIAVVATCSFALMPGTFSNWIDGDRQPMADAAEFVRERMTGDTWIFAESHGLLSLQLFGFERERPAGIGDPEAPRALAECPPSPSELASIDADGGRALFVVRAQDLMARGGDAGAFADWLRSKARILERVASRRFDYHRNELVILERSARGERAR